ncbi:unnamed protein product [Ectocarpus sp. 12 AP-2014]
MSMYIQFRVASSGPYIVRVRECGYPPSAGEIASHNLDPSIVRVHSPHNPCCLLVQMHRESEAHVLNESRQYSDLQVDLIRATRSFFVRVYTHPRLRRGVV